MARVVLENLSKSFPDGAGGFTRAVHRFSVVVEDGDLLVLVGPSGCGKTTLLRLIAGLETPSDGAVFIGQQAMNGLPPQRREVAMVFQNYALYPHLSVFDNLALPLRLRRLPKAEIAPRVQAAAAALELAPLLHRLPRELSGGQRQRVALGRALVRQPQVFLLDEPLGNLDAPSRVQMRQHLLQLQEKLKATMIYVTHDQLEALTLGRRIAVMNQGQLQQLGPPREIYDAPANLFVAGFIGSPPMNLWRGILRADAAAIWFHAEPSPTRELSLRLFSALGANCAAYLDRPIVLGLRPEAMTCLAAATTDQDETTVLATLKRVELLGSESLVHLDLGGLAGIARQAGPVPQFDAGVTVRLDPAQAHFFDPHSGQRLTLH